MFIQSDGYAVLEQNIKTHGSLYTLEEMYEKAAAQKNSEK